VIKYKYNVSACFASFHRSSRAGLVMDDFTVILPSNSSMEYFPDNAITRFRTKLAQEINLEGNWVCALTNLIYVKSWYQIPQGAGMIKFSCSDCLDFRHPDSDASAFSVAMRLPFGYYNTIHEIVAQLNKVLHDTLSTSLFPVVTKENVTILSKMPESYVPSFTYDERKQKVSCALASGASIAFDEILSHVLGIREKITGSGENPTKVVGGQYTADITAGITAMYVYCDILEPIRIGDTMAPLLRVVDTAGQTNEIISKEFRHPYYAPIRKKSFDNLEIFLCDGTGSPMKFESGRVILTLHFKRAKQKIFAI
jgi:hypothetical protein